SADQSIDPPAHQTQYLGGAFALTKTQYRNADDEFWHNATAAINRNLPTMRPDSSKIVAQCFAGGILPPHCSHKAPDERAPTSYAGSVAKLTMDPCRRKSAGGRSRPLQKTFRRKPMQSKAQIDQILRQKSDAVEIPGVVAVAANGSDVIYEGAFGKRDLSKDDPMTADSVFWIASMTKAVTTAGAMQLVEQGKLSLDE